MNLVARTTTSTAPVIVRPRALITRERCIRRRTRASVSVRSSRVQCLTMPVWLVVNEMKTPTMYSWMSLVTSASNATMSAPAAAARKMIPLL